MSSNTSLFRANNCSTSVSNHLDIASTNLDYDSSINILLLLWKQTTSHQSFSGHGDVKNYDFLCLKNASSFCKKIKAEICLEIVSTTFRRMSIWKSPKVFYAVNYHNGNHILPSYAFWNHPRNILSAEEICFHGAGRSFNKGTDVHIRSVRTAYWENLSGNIFSGLIIDSYPYFFPWLYFCIAKNFGN